MAAAVDACTACGQNEGHRKLSKLKDDQREMNLWQSWERNERVSCVCVRKLLMWGDDDAPLPRQIVSICRLLCWPRRAAERFPHQQYLFKNHFRVLAVADDAVQIGPSKVDLTRTLFFISYRACAISNRISLKSSPFAIPHIPRGQSARMPFLSLRNQCTRRA